MEYIINHYILENLATVMGELKYHWNLKWKLMEILGNCWELPSRKQEDGQPSNPVDHSLRAAPRAVSP